MEDNSRMWKRVFLACAAVSVISGCQLTQTSDSSQSSKIPDTSTDNAGYFYTIAELMSPPLLSVDENNSEAEFTNLWDRIRAQMHIEIPEHEHIEAQRNWYLSHPNYMSTVSDRAAPFLYLIVEEIEKRNLPLELVLVPIVESTFDTFAYSNGHASGLWQFIPSTARHYGIPIDWWYDGRRDILRATTTALDYFDRLQAMFNGDWLLALAAYNAGQGRVLNAMRRNERLGKPTDFWHLTLPQETRNYVPKILALAELLKDSEKWAVNWPSIPNHKVTEIVDVGHQVDLTVAADLAGIPLTTLHQYNAGYNRLITSPNGPHTLLVPLESAEQLRSALNAAKPTDLLSWQRHRIRSGESLSTIAQRYNVTVESLQQFNNLNGSLIRRGDYLLIPSTTQALERFTLTTEQRLATNLEQQTQRKIEHRIVQGDTLWDLARRYQVTVANLLSWNNMAANDVLRPGQTLVVWQQSSGTTSTANTTLRTMEYQVRNGDSLARIASRFRVTIADIERWNSISRDRFLQPGQRLTLHVDVTKVTL